MRLSRKKTNHHLDFYQELKESLERFSDDYQKLKEYQSSQKQGINHEIKMKSFKTTQIFVIRLSKKISQTTGWKLKIKLKKSNNNNNKMALLVWLKTPKER